MVDPFSLTRDQEADATPEPGMALTEQPERIGRYRVDRVLGKGSFGIVYLAHDEQLDRPVAVKVPHVALISGPEDAEVYLAEARTVAKLDHPNIVPVHDVGSTDDCPCYIVSKYVEGTDLATRMKERRPTYTKAADLTAKLATALHYAHKQGLVHRDVKPGNVLIGSDDQPYVVDFGLALSDEDVGKGPKHAGTPAYMSPEQACGEGHRVDGRSDIFSLGVVLYELLSARKPFRGETRAELLEQVASYEPRPLRQFDEKLPKELERICLKSLAKRASQRYSTAYDMAEDLRHFLDQQAVSESDSAGSVRSAAAIQTPTSASGSTASSAHGLSSAADSQQFTIACKGLRSYDARDADFFLELLPGARDREGLPDKLRFWKTRVEEVDPDNTFPVGMIYGPSGCGKSSLVRAGLLPRLSDDVVAVYIEATPEETESRLLRVLRQRCPELEADQNIVDTMAALRRGQGIPPGKKLLIVLDQFEQWLHAKRGKESNVLVQALRQCDGGRLQCIVMVRDDFWMATTRFMRELEIQISEGENSAVVDLFPVRHARRVLAAFGRSFGALPADPRDTSQVQKTFLKTTVAELAVEGKVICVRLALFAEMIKGKPWTPTTLKEVGGTQGVGVTFLEETFSARTARAEYRHHQQAARAVLKSLLPETGTGIKGQMKSYNELLEACGRPQDFDGLMKILDGELRLITPTEKRVEGEEGKEEEGDPNVLKTGIPTNHHSPLPTRYYQLTHDYLVPSLREWLTRKQKESRRGRAELCLAELAAIWNAKRENRHLPSWWEHLQIRWLTNRKEWTAPQCSVMRQAARWHGLWTGAVVIALAAIGLTSMSTWHTVVEQRSRSRVAGLVGELPNVEVGKVSAIVANLQELRQTADPLLSTEFAKAGNERAKLHYSLALLPTDKDQIDYLFGRLLNCSPVEFSVVRSALLKHKDNITSRLWQVVQDDQQLKLKRFHAAAALAEYEPTDERWSNINTFVASYLTQEIPTVQFGHWLESLRSARRPLVEPLVRIHADREDENFAKRRLLAANALADYLSDEPMELAEVILVADEYAEYGALVESLRPHAARVIGHLTEALQTKLPSRLAVANDQLLNEDSVLRDAHLKRQSIAAVTLVHLEQGETVWPLLEFTPDPSLRSLIAFYLGKLGADTLKLAERLQSESKVSIRRALIQSLGRSEVPRAQRAKLTEQLLALHAADPDPGIHSSSAWALRQWGVALPERLPSEQDLTKLQDHRVATTEATVIEISRRLAAYKREELPLRQAAWERELRERPPPPLDAGLVTHYAFDETDGNEIANAVAGEPGGVYQGLGQPEWVPGFAGSARRLDQGGGYFDCGDACNPTTMEAFSYGCWLYSESESQIAMLFEKRDREGGSFRGIRLDLRRNRLFAFFFNEMLVPRFRAVLHRSVDAISTGEWHHIFVTYDGSTSTAGITIYIDGRVSPVVEQRIRAASSKPARDNVPLFIGRLFRDGAVRMDNVRFYDRELTADGVQQLHEAGLQSLAKIPTEDRRPDQQAVLAGAYKLQDEQLRAMQDERWDSAQRWYVNGQGQTMALIRNPGEYTSTPIGYSYLICAHEVTVEEYLRFRPQYREGHPKFGTLYSSLDCPVYSENWYAAAEYCNWLSEQEGIPRDQWVYLPNAAGEFAAGMRIRERFQELDGYHLPTEVEWEHACRAGTRGSYCFGELVPLLKYYAYYSLNSLGRCHPVGSLLPNETGLFDMHGHLFDWTQTPASGAMSPVKHDIPRLIIGGGTHVSAGDSRSWYHRPDHKVERAHFAIRPTRTYKWPAAN